MQHAALLYASVDDVVRRTVPLIDETLDDGGGVLVCLDQVKVDAIRSRLGARAGSVTFRPSEVRYANPARAVLELSRYLERQRDEGVAHVHSIGEITLDGSDADFDWLRYEAAVNDIFADEPLRATCLYPRSLDAESQRAIARTHPLLHEEGLTRSRHYDGAIHACAHLPAPQVAPAREPDLVLDCVTNPRDARSALDDLLTLHFRSDRDGNLALLTSELVTNAIIHGSGTATVSLWIEPSTVVLAVRDDGPGIDDPFAGLRPPSLPERGAGLWVAHHLSDRIAIERRDGVTTITARLDSPSN
jgi:anti-sigma regulatory factor (Ser/Thr protein kinase)